VTEITKCPGPAAVYVGTRVRAAGFIRVYISPPLANGTAGEGKGATRGRGTERKREEAECNRRERAGREEQNDDGARAADMGETRVKDEDGGGVCEPRAHINLLNRTSASRRISFVRALHLPARAKRGAVWRAYAPTTTPAANWQTAQFNPPSCDVHLPASPPLVIARAQLSHKTARVDRNTCYAVQQ